MRNVFLVIRHEVDAVLRKPSFWLMTFLFPAFIIAITIVSQVVARTAFEDLEGNPLSGGGGPAIGYVDHAGVIARLPEGLPPGLLEAFPDEASARAALEAGRVSQYYVVPADFIASGDLVLIDSEFSPFSTFTTSSLFEYLIRFNLVGDSALANLVLDPTLSVRSEALAPEPPRDASDPLSFFVPFAVLFIFFFVITTSSGFMLQSVSKEKENRVMEVLLISLRPRELMLGKVVGLGLVALFQMAIWLGGGLLALDRGTSLLGVAGSFELPPGFVVWALLYFVLGYLTYASLLGAIGALAPSAREGTQFTFVAMLPLMIPLWVNPVFTESPDGALATILSLFPLTAPTSMITRLAASSVPIEQLLIGLAGLAVTAYVFVLLSARFFRADTLLSTSRFNWRRMVSGLRR